MGVDGGAAEPLGGARNDVGGDRGVPRAVWSSEFVLLGWNLVLEG